jgi:hypothetical protein
MAAKNKLGYDYYTSLPGSIVKNCQKKWRKMLAGQSKKKQSPKPAMTSWHMKGSDVSPAKPLGR